MEIFFLLIFLVLWFFLSKKITNNSNHSSFNPNEDPWQSYSKPEFKDDKEKLDLYEDDKYMWTLNDSIQHYNDLSINNRLTVLRGISKFINEIDQEDRSIEFFKNQMLYWTNKRQQFVAEGPSANWVLAATLESICQMLILEETDLVRKFLSSPPIQQFGK
jgi:hypothetical protein